MRWYLDVAAADQTNDGVVRQQAGHPGGGQGGGGVTRGAGEGVGAARGGGVEAVPAERVEAV